ncbi:hypothetical protein HYALB_00010701 [Hymenoscyphus albidus]|uniref:Uncharacterized protein n=1 Tax=Hymenoscyphus albidus TaxID=595503 RepID=A0A9N9M6Z7_9HELO|nr:hypothetical protein HYALB_00010701 [Hymenoscyphus albidus]
MVRPPPELQLYLPPQFRDEDLDQRGFVDATPVEIEKFSHIQEENPVSIAAGGEKEGNSNEGSKTGADDEEDMIGATRWQKEKRRKQRLLANSEQAQKPLKKEGAKAKVSQKGSEASTQSTKDAKTKAAQKPLSKAERRKKIKEEILAAGEGESYQGYRRRKW